jgi:2-iminoacetate synthase ThiH
MTLIEMKSHAYDLLANIEHLQNELKNVNQAIGLKIKEQQESAKKETPIKEIPKKDGQKN